MDDRTLDSIVLDALLDPAALMLTVEQIATRIADAVRARLGADHFVDFGDDGWAIEHSVDCRLSATPMHDCPIHLGIDRWTSGDPFDGDYVDYVGTGRWRIDGFADGAPVLVRPDE